MAEIKPVEPIQMGQMMGQMWNPMQAAGQFIQMENLAINQRQLAEQQRSHDLTAKLQALKDNYPHASALTQYHITREWMNLAGFPPSLQPAPELFNAKPELFQTLVLSDLGSTEQKTAFDEFMKLTPEARKLSEEIAKQQMSVKGMQQIGERAGAQLSPLESSAIAQSPALQTQAGQAAFPSEEEKQRARLSKAQTDAIEQKTAALNEREAAINIEGRTILEGSKPINDLAREVTELGPTFQSLAAMSPLDRVKNLQIVSNSNPKYREFRESLPQRLEQAKSYAKQITLDMSAIENRRELAAFSALPKGETLTTITAKYQAIRTLKDLADAQVNFLENQTTGPAHPSVVQTFLERVNSVKAHVQSLVTAREDVGRDRMMFAQNKYDRDQSTKAAQFDMESYYFTLIGNKVDDAQARRMTVQYAQQKYPGLGLDANQLKDPSKSGNMTVTFGSPGERKDIAEGRSMIQQIDTIVSTFEPTYVGALDAKLGKVGQALDVLSPARQDWIQNLRQLESDLRHERYGASLTPQEYKIALSELPNEGMGDQQFLSAAKAWRNKWNSLLQERQKTLTPGGIQPDELETLQRKFPNEPMDRLKKFLEERGK